MAHVCQNSAYVAGRDRVDPPANLIPLLTLIRSPGISINSFSESLGVTNGHASNIAKKLELLGAITKERSGKEILLAPRGGSKITSALSELDSVDTGEVGIEELIEPVSNLRMISLLASGPKTIEWMTEVLGCSRSTLYRILRRFGPKGGGLIAVSGSKERTYALNREHPAYRPIRYLALSIFPVEEGEHEVTSKVSAFTNIRCRILKYLSRFISIGDDFIMPEELTQKGVAQALWTTQSTVSKELKKLIMTDMVMIKRSRIRYQKRRRKTYHLTPEGIQEAMEIIPLTRGLKVPIVDHEGIGSEVEIEKVTDLLQTPVTPLEILNYLVNHDVILFNRFQYFLESQRGSQFISELHRSPILLRYFGRSEEREEFMTWIGSNRSKLMMIDGEAGIGKTTFISKMIQDLRGEWDTFYYTLNEWGTPRSLLTNLAYFLQKENRPELRSYLENRSDLNVNEVVLILERSLDRMKVILIIDDAHKADGRIRSLFLSMMKGAISNDIKFIFAGRSVPLFDKFHGDLRRIVIEGLDRKASADMLRDKGLKGRNLERTYDHTKGHPLALELIGNQETVRYLDLETLIEEEIVPSFSDLERMILGFSSIFRYPFSMEALLLLKKIDGVEEALGEGDDKALDSALHEMVEKLVERAVLTYSGNAYRLHDTFRNVLYRTIDEKTRRRYHGLASDHYRDMENDPARIEATHHMISRGDLPQAIAFLGRFGPSLIMRGFSEDLKGVVSRIPMDDLDDRSLIEYHYILGEIQYILGDWDKALQNYTLSYNLCEKEGVPGSMTRSKIRQARIRHMRGEHKDAIMGYQEVLDLAHEHGQFILESNAVRHLGSICYIQGDVDCSEEYYQRAMEIARGTNSKECLANAYSISSLLCKLKHDYTRGETQIRASMRIYDELGDNNQKLRAMNNLAWICSLQNRWEEALDICEEMTAVARSTGDFLHTGFGLINSADILVHEGRLDEAEEKLEVAYRQFIMLDEKRLTHFAEQVYGMMYKKMGEVDRSREFFNRSIEGYRENNIINHLPEIYYEFGDMEEGDGNEERARELFEEALVYSRQMKDRMWLEKVQKRLDGFA